MSLIYVRSKPDRRAYYEGRVIPNDKFFPVVDSPYIRRLIDHWQDLEIEPDKKTADKSASQPAAPQPTALRPTE